ncbi:MAG: hypothetical protein IKL48_06395 [Elusimicrobiaceae bacterium]|nr:hypothetical protein [Elusimicrobiaceae bacterium]
MKSSLPAPRSKLKNPSLRSGFKFILSSASPSGRLVDPKRLQAGLAVFAFRRKDLSSAQTKTSLRLSRPHACKAVCLLPALN